MEMTEKEILEALKSNFDFGVSFIVDNQFRNIQDRLKAEGFSVNSEVEAKAVLVKLIGENPDLAKTVLGSLTYDDSADNYTGGLDLEENRNDNKEKINSNSEVNTKSFMAILPSILGAVGSVLGAINQNQLNMSNDQFGNLNDMAQFQEEQRLLALEEEKRKRNGKIAVVVFVVLAGVVGFLIYRGIKKNKASKADNK